MVLRRPGTPLELSEVVPPKPGKGELLVEVECCAVCRTDLHVVDGELANPKLPLIANLTRQDGLDFFARLGTLRIETERHVFPLEAANDALRALREGEITGTAVLGIG
jgi:D-arabinose 1-dehydrogenase-like Zn-dependent alcohol dehydrogenase